MSKRDFTPTPHILLTRYLHATIEYASSVICVEDGGRVQMMWNVKAGKYAGNDYSIHEHPDATSRQVTSGEAKKLVLWLDPETITQDNEETFYGYVAVPTEVALTTLYGGPNEEAPYLTEHLEREVN